MLNPCHFHYLKGGFRRNIDQHQQQNHHSPRQHLGDQPGAFYTVAGLGALRAHIKPGGLFGMWSNDPPDAPFVDEMERSFRTVEVEEIRFPNPYQDREATCTLYFGRT